MLVLRRSTRFDPLNKSKFPAVLPAANITTTKHTSTSKPSSASKSVLSTISPLPTLSDGTLTVFREFAFHPARPYLLPRGYFTGQLPAIASWFRYASSRPTGPASLNTAYLTPHGDHIVPLELTTSPSPPAATTTPTSFTRFEAPLSLFLASFSPPPSTPPPQAKNLYLAQHPLSQLPAQLKPDFPTPELVQSAGKGDIYDSSLWLGRAPTATPLHRDPNPNLLVQMAGRKVIRVFEPEVGREIYAGAAAGAGRSGRVEGGEEMMGGVLREMLDDAVWSEGGVGERVGMEGVLDRGDAVFVPKGWWHAVKGVGEGVVGSVNWWFR